MTANRRRSATSVESDVRELLAAALRRPALTLQLVRKFWRLYLGTALGWRIPGGSTGYTRFLIIGRFRSGSNLVRGSLMSHPHIAVYGDVFRTSSAIKLGLPFYPERRLLDVFRNDPVAFLETHVFSPFPRDIAAVGLKLLYPNGRHEQWPRMRDHLAADPELRVIHVKRWNVLRSHLSLRLTMRDRRWKELSRAGQTREPITLSPEECLEAFTSTRLAEQEHDRLFASHPMLQVSYEGLCSDYQGECNRMLSFLGARSLPLSALTQRQSTTPLSEAIANYSDLKAAFENTEWLPFFED